MELLRKLVSLVRVPLTKWYLRKERNYEKSGIKIVVRPGVFHPGLFPSTGMLIQQLETMNLHGRLLLELGCGSGLIAILASKAGAIVTATDVSAAAIENTKANVAGNHAQVVVQCSDLFDQIPQQLFDCVVINPPYYARHAESDAEKAWYCGPDFEFFRKLFPQLKRFTNINAEILMTLARNANIDAIKAIAGEHGYTFLVMAERSSILDGTDYLFRLKAQ